MKTLILAFSTLIAAMFWSVSSVAAEKIPQELENVGIEEKLGHQVDLGLTFRNELGQVIPLRNIVDGRKPTLLFIVYFKCPNLCNFFLNGAVEALQKLQMTPGKEYQIITASMDPREDYMLASQKKASYIKFYGREESAVGWHFLTDAAPEVLGVSRDHISPDLRGHVKQLAEQVGFKYKFNKEENQFAHTAAMMVLTPDGRISRYLYGIEFQPKDLRLALAEASGNKIGNVVDRLLLFCYHYDPKTKKYSLYAKNLMSAAGALTVLLLGFYIASFWRRENTSRKKREGLGLNGEL